MRELPAPLRRMGIVLLAFLPGIRPLYGVQQPKDVGLLLTLQGAYPGIAGEYADGTRRAGLYQTFWITRIAGEVHVDVSPNILVPRSDGFWQLGSRFNAWEGKRVEFIWRTPLGGPIRIPELSKGAVDSLEDRATVAHPIRFISGDYIVSGTGVSDLIASLYTYRFDDSAFAHPLEASAVLGTGWAVAQKQGLSAARDQHMVAALSMQDQCEVVASGTDWNVTRNQGRWVIGGWGSWNNEPDCGNSDFVDYLTPLRAPPAMVGFDELPLAWSRIRKSIPEAVDAFGSPTRDLLAVLTSGELLVCPVATGGIGAPVARFNLQPAIDGRPIMAQWALGRFVAGWGEQFRKFKQSPGPHDE